jgi:hypothetical protein
MHPSAVREHRKQLRRELYQLQHPKKIAKCSKLNTKDCPILCAYFHCCQLCERACTGRGSCKHYSTNGVH